ncbi:hypothetical protein [Shimia sp.]|uniref:hypothetical protein n=1 Tax=Shimia sp. TaxID=1954381 RepID=UPI003296F482
MTESPGPVADNAAIDFSSRITFHDAEQCMEVDFSEFHLDNSVTVNRVYDLIEDQIAKSGEPKWFFLINYSHCKIDQTAWVAHSRRGRALNLAHSQGTVRFEASEATKRQIERSANTESFDANLFSDRASAMARIADLPSQRKKRIRHDPNYTEHDFARRLSFDHDKVIMDVNFSHFTFHHARDVDDFYDFIEDRIKETDRKWFFLIDYNACQIMPLAWVRYAYRGKRLNKAASLGSVRYAAGSETEADIRLRAESQGFRPNIRNTRDEALTRIEEMRVEVLAQLGSS